MTDISSTLEADSTQINAVDLVGSDRTVTVESVRVVKGEQPVNIRLVEVEGKEYRPSKSMRRVLAACWGPDSATWVGRRMTIYRDPSVKWGGKAIGGIKISAVSHIDKTMTVMLQESSTTHSSHKVEPLPDAAPTRPDLSTRITKALEWFAAQGVQQSNLEAQLDTPVSEWTAANLDDLLARRDALVAEIAQPDADPQPEGSES